MKKSQPRRRRSVPAKVKLNRSGPAGPVAGPAVSGSSPRDLAEPAPDQVDAAPVAPDGSNAVPNAPNGSNASGNVVADQLRALLASDIPAAARVNAARTLAEIEGLIGRHQRAPERDQRPVSVLSRDELISELHRLRTAFELGLVR